MKTARVSSTIKNKIKNAIRNKDNPNKGPKYRYRNWHGYNEEGVKEVTTAPPKKLTKLQKAEVKRKAALEDKLAMEKLVLERTAPADTFVPADFSGEEQGFFKLGNKIIETIFPR